MSVVGPVASGALIFLVATLADIYLYAAVLMFPHVSVVVRYSHFMTVDAEIFLMALLA